MNHIELTTNYKHFDTNHRFTYHEFGNLIEWEVLVKLKWWKRIFRTDGQEYTWKRVYFGHATPIEKCLETYKQGQKQIGQNSK